MSASTSAKSSRTRASSSLGSRCVARGRTALLMLRYLWMLGAAATAFVSSANAAQAQPGSRDAMRREVESRTRAMSAAFARTDMRAVAAFYADDGEIYTPGGAVIRGRRAIDRFWDHVQHPKSWTMTTT